MTALIMILGMSFMMQWPVTGWISSGYGDRTNPVTGDKEFHAGVDISAGVGTQVMAAATGTVVMTGQTDGDGYYVVIKHANGYTTFYAHLSIVLVRIGEKVLKGSFIGRVGDSGLSTGPHLHFGIRRNGMPVNPLLLAFLNAYIYRRHEWRLTPKLRRGPGKNHF